VFFFFFFIKFLNYKFKQGKNFSLNQRKYGKTIFGLTDLALSGTELKILIFVCIYSLNLKIAATFPQR